MNNGNDSKGVNVPKLNIEHNSSVEDASERREEVSETDVAANELDDAVGFVKGAGSVAWRYAVKHPHTAIGALAGFIAAVLILTVGLWATIVIVVFVVVGALIGQIRDGDNSIVNFFGRLFGGRH